MPQSLERHGSMILNGHAGVQRVPVCCQPSAQLLLQPKIAPGLEQTPDRREPAFADTLPDEINIGYVHLDHDDLVHREG
jgi:hypothetical protein